MVEIFKWQCPECGKEIISVHKKQFEYNRDQHLESHERKNTSNVEVGSGNNEPKE